MSNLAYVKAGSAPRNKNFTVKRITRLIRIASSRVNDPTRVWVFFVLLHYVLRYAAIDRGQRRYGRTVAQFLQGFMQLLPDQAGQGHRPVTFHNSFGLRELIKRKIRRNGGKGDWLNFLPFIV